MGDREEKSKQFLLFPRPPSATWPVRTRVIHLLVEAQKIINSGVCPAPLSESFNHWVELWAGRINGRMQEWFICFVWEPAGWKGVESNPLQKKYNTDYFFERKERKKNKTERTIGTPKGSQTSHWFKPAASTALGLHCVSDVWVCVNPSDWFLGFHLQVLNFTTRFCILRPTFSSGSTPEAQKCMCT